MATAALALAILALVVAVAVVVAYRGDHYWWQGQVDDLRDQLAQLRANSGGGAEEKPISDPPP